MTPAPPVTTILCGMCNLLRSDRAHRRDDALTALSVHQSACRRHEIAAQRGIVDQCLYVASEVRGRAVAEIADIDAAFLAGEPPREHALGLDRRSQQHRHTHIGELPYRCARSGHGEIDV